MKSLIPRIRHEFNEVWPVTLFFFVAFQLLALTHAMILRQYGIPSTAFLGATFVALVVAKVVVISDHFKMVNRFPDKPLIYNVVWKTVIYFVAWLGVRYLENFFHFFSESHNPVLANHRLWREIIWPHFWAVQMWMFIMLLMYCAFRELVRALGRDRIIRMFFYSPVDQPPQEGAADMT
jgi:hypothetical protein